MEADIDVKEMFIKKISDNLFRVFRERSLRENVPAKDIFYEIISPIIRASKIENEAAPVPAVAAANRAIMQCRLHTEIDAQCDVLGNDCRCGAEPCHLQLHNC